MQGTNPTDFKGALIFINTPIITASGQETFAAEVISPSGATVLPLQDNAVFEAGVASADTKAILFAGITDSNWTLGGSSPLAFDIASGSASLPLSSPGGTNWTVPPGTNLVLVAPVSASNSGASLIGLDAVAITGSSSTWSAAIVNVPAQTATPVSGINGGGSVALNW